MVSRSALASSLRPAELKRRARWTALYIFRRSFGSGRGPAEAGWTVAEKATEPGDRSFSLVSFCRVGPIAGVLLVAVTLTVLRCFSFTSAVRLRRLRLC